MTRLLVTLLIVLGAFPALAAAHAERATYFPDHNAGSRPTRDLSSPEEIVCKADSAKRIRHSWKGKGKKITKARKARLRMVKKCRYEHIQAAVDAAKSGDRIVVLPGIYHEEPSAKLPVRDPKCEGGKYWEKSGDNHTVDGMVPTFALQAECPNSRNLIAVIGDSENDPDRVCDHKCHLTLEGMGRKPRAVVVVGDRFKQDVLRVDRADGFQLRNMTFEQGAYNNVDMVETNGFVIKNVVTRYASHYGILTFTSDNGLYDHVEAYGSGDSGVYPGSGPERHCADYGIVMQHINSYGNTLGSSGTAGNGTWTRDSDFHDNAAGIANDSFAPGHPGMPQDCSKWTGNKIHSNNTNFFVDENDAYCIATPFEKRDRKHVCPVFQVVVGTGLMFYGVNDNIISHNMFWDQHRDAIRQFHVPAAARGDYDPAHQLDTSNGNRYEDNTFGVRPDGTPDRNGTDIYWDEQGMRNCFERNKTAPGVPLTSDPATLPSCAGGGSTNPNGSSAKLAADLPCIFWNPRTNTDPPGCTWFTTPADPGDSGPTPPPERSGAFGGASTSPMFTTGVTPVSRPGDSARAPLTFAKDPELVTPSELPHDRVLVGVLRNTSSQALRLTGEGAVLRDDAGNTVRGSVSYAHGFSHGLYGAGAAGPKEPMPEFQAERLGAVAIVQPGDTVPFTVAWRRGDGANAPVSAELGSATVALPATG